MKWGESKRRQVVAALARSSPAKAARECTISRDTLYRWLKEPEFMRAVEAARSEEIGSLRKRLRAMAGGIG
jgi:hypothetical protein